jgi:hypothetical protein
MTDERYTENELDNALFVEVNKMPQDIRVVRALIKEGANVNALHTCSEWEHVKEESVLMSILRYISRGDKYPNRETVKTLLDAGANPNYQGCGNYTIACLCFTGRYDLVELLLKAGADPNVQASDDEASTMLNLEETDEWFEQYHNDEEFDPKHVEDLHHTVHILRQYGARGWYGDLEETGVYGSGERKVAPAKKTNLRTVKEQSPEICLAAVTEDGYALQYVKAQLCTAEQYLEICRAAIKQDEYALKYVKKERIAEEQYRELCLEAIEINEWTYQFVRGAKTPEFILAAVRRNGCVLRWIKKQTAQIVRAALAQDRYAEKYVKDRYILMERV